MIRCKLAVCADSVVRDAQSNLVSVFNIAETINAQFFPVGLTRLSSLFILTREPGDPERNEVVFSVTFDGAPLLPPTTLPANFTGSGLISRQVVSIQGLLVPKAGNVHVAISAGGTELGSWDVAFVLVPGTQTVLPGIGSALPVSGGPVLEGDVLKKAVLEKSQSAAPEPRDERPEQTPADKKDGD